jgi:hypothetical protein
MPVDFGLCLFAVEGTRDYGERVAHHLELILGAHEERGLRTASTRFGRSPRFVGRTCS